MENFFNYNYIVKPLPPEDVDIWFRINNIIPEKLELYYDFTQSLNRLITDTYLGDETVSNETKIILNNEDKIKHFDWCYTKVIDNFKKEGLLFENNGEAYDYFKRFFLEVFYNQKDEMVRKSLDKFFKELFDMNTPFSKSDLDMVTLIYKSFNKNLKILD